MKKKFVCALLVLCAAFASAQTAVVRDIRGTVEIKTPESPVWVQAAPGTVLRQDTTVSTGFKSSAILAVGNSMVTVRPLTRLTLTEIINNQGNEHIVMELRTGRIRADVKAPPEGKIDFSIRSPIATAAVRGTIFDFDTVTLQVDEGIVRYSGERSGQAVSVRGREASFVNEISGRANRPKEIVMAELVPDSPAGAAESGLLDAPRKKGPAPESGSNPGNIDMAIRWRTP
jgi:hypothetical protein